MSLRIDRTAEDHMAISGHVPNQLVFNTDGSLGLAARTASTAPRALSVASIEDVQEYGGKPKFSVEVWPGKAESIPEGYVQSSGQQLADLAFPQMREDVVATQLSCSETDWQADPYKRVTHWSLGDGVSWMRPPDKNGVQPGNVGTFYGAGSNPAGTKTGTAVIDAMRNITGKITGISQTAVTPVTAPKSALSYATGGQDTLAPGSYALNYRELYFNAADALPTGTTTDPITGEFRPRTWYGIWMIRMYGRVISNGEVSVQGLLNQLDIANAKIATLQNDIGFTIIYPNGGTEAAPANVALSSRYISANPFPGYSCKVVPEVLVGGVWGDPGWDYDAGGSGVRAHCVDGVGIVTISANVYIVGNMSQTGGAFPIGTTPTTASPIRVKVWKGGKLA